MDMTQMIINFLVNNNPSAQRAWAQAQQMLQGKTADEQAEYVQKLMESKGVTKEGLNRFASTIGINLK